MMLDTKEKARIAWHCRRGMLELDLIFQTVLEHQLDTFSMLQVDTFKSLLTHTDPELFAWLMGHLEPPKEFKELVTLIRNHR